MVAETDSNWDNTLIRAKNFFTENNAKSQKFQQRRLGPFTVKKRVTNTFYQIQDDKHPTNLKTVHRDNLVDESTRSKSILNDRRKSAYESTS